MKIRKMHFFAALLFIGLIAWRFSGFFPAQAWVLAVWRVIVAPYFLAGAAAIPLAIVFGLRWILRRRGSGFVTVRKLLLSAVIWLAALVVWRVAAIFVPYIWVRWIWWVLISPYIPVGGIISILLLMLTILCLGRIRYRIDACISDEKTVYVEVSYLMRLIHFVLEYREEKLDANLRIAGMRLGGEKSRKKKRKINVSKKEAKSKSGNIAAKQEESTGDTGTTDYATKDAAHTASAAKISPPEPEEEENEKKDRLKPLKQAKAVLTHPDRKIIMRLCLKCLQKFMKALKPKHLDIHGVIGFDDPSVTGQVMGAYEAAMGVMGLRHKVRILGNYFEKALELNIEAEGRTRLWGLIWPLIWLYLRKPIRVILHKYL